MAARYGLMERRAMGTCFARLGALLGSDAIGKGDDWSGLTCKRTSVALGNCGNYPSTLTTMYAQDFAARTTLPTVPRRARTCERI